MSSLPRSTASAQRVDAARVLAFLDAVASRDIEMHSLMLIRHGHVVAEGWWSPYRADRLHLLYSVSKSFTSTAVGIAIAEGLFSLDDRIVNFFPDKIPDDVSPLTRVMRVRDLLAMASGHTRDTLDQLVAGGDDATKTFLSIPPDEPPGTLFCYNQGCPYTLSAIITRLTGGRLLDYFRSRLFEPLGIESAQWAPFHGIDPGFSGLHLTTEAVAKLGLLHLQNGIWERRQLVPAAYIADAHCKHSDTSKAKQDPDWILGYGYQFWVCQHDTYRAEGAFGQLSVVIPAADAVITCTARQPDMQVLMDLFWEHLLPALPGAADPDPDPDADAELELTTRLASLSVRPLDVIASGPSGSITFERSEIPAPDTEALRSIRLAPAGGAIRLIAVVGDVEHVFDLLPDQWCEGELPGLHPSLDGMAISGGWVAKDEFAADVISLSAPHRLKLRGSLGERPSLEASWFDQPLI